MNLDALSISEELNDSLILGKACNNTGNIYTFIQKLLNPNPLERMGSKGLDEIKNHPFLEGVNWTNLTQN